MKSLALRIRESTSLFIPIVLVGLITYLPIVPWLGFFHDDWYVVASKVGGVSLTEMFYSDRPWMGRFLGLIYQLVNVRVVGWHLVAILLRIVYALAFAQLLVIRLPGRRPLVTLMAILSLIYPGYSMLPSAATYPPHYFAMTLALISIALSLKALQAERWWATLILGLASAALAFTYLRIVEYFIGFEIARIVIVAERILPSLPGILKRLKLQLATSLLLPLGAGSYFLYWRFAVFQSSRPATDLQRLAGLYQGSPLEQLTTMFARAVTDFFNLTILAWVVPFQTKSIGDTTLGSVLLAALLVATVVGLLLVFARKFGVGPVVDAELNDHPAGLAGVGALLVVLTILPVIVSGRHVEFRFDVDRYTLQSIPAVILFVTGSFFMILKPRRIRATFLGLLGLCVFLQFYNALSFARRWELHRQFWWELTWRAPQIEQDTLLAVEMGEGFGLAENYEVWAPANLIYYPAERPIGIAARILDHGMLTDLQTGAIIRASTRGIAYYQYHQNLLLLTMNRADGTCLHVLDERRPEISSFESSITYLAAPYSRESRIAPDGNSAIPPSSVFGSEPQHGWCYYYQRANFSRQVADWEEVVRLGDEALRRGLGPQDSSEWMPFFEGYLREGQRQQVSRIGRIMREDEPLRIHLCVRVRGGAELEGYFGTVENFRLAQELLCGTPSQ